MPTLREEKVQTQVAAKAPTIRTLVVETLRGSADSECITLLQQVMAAYPNANHPAVAAWFHCAYSVPK